MREDWRWTVEEVYDNDDGFYPRYDWERDSICVGGGIDGSIWATPVMNVYFKNGKREIIECYIDDGNTSPETEINNEAKQFALATGGMDYLE